MTHYILGNLLTGRRIVDLNVIEGPWSTGIKSAGTISCTVDLNDPAVQALGLRNSAEVAQTFLGIVEGDVIKEAGPLWTSTYKRDDGTMQLGAANMASLFDHRLILPLLAQTLSTDLWTIPDPLDATKTIPNPALSTVFTNMSLATRAKRLIQQALTWTGGNVPIVFQADEVEARTDTILGTDFKSVWSAVQDIMNRGSGPEVALIPRFTTDNLGAEWVLRTGTIAQPLITSTSVLFWNITAAETAVSGLEIDKDGSNMGSLSWQTGGRAIADVLVSRAYDPLLINASYPLMETLDSSHTDVVLQGTLDDYTRSDVAAGRAPTSVWSMNVQARPTDQYGNPSAPWVDQYSAGDFADLYFAPLDPVTGLGDLLYPEGGTFRHRITSMSGDAKGEQIKLTFAPTIGA